jgi:hypothetical protein
VREVVEVGEDEARLLVSELGVCLEDVAVHLFELLV